MEPKGTTTIEYVLYRYEDQVAAGNPLDVKVDKFKEREDAVALGSAWNGTLYEVQAVVTTVFAPCKRYPKGDTQISKLIVERKALRDPSWWAAWIKERMKTYALQIV